MRLLEIVKKPYHFLMAVLGAVIFGFPSKKIKVVGITGTKGKTSTAEFVNSILESAGYKTALAGTMRFKIGKISEPNIKKMTMPGRFFLQNFIRKAVSEKCDWLVLEMTSQGVAQFRHKFIYLDALIVTNVSPEHIEAHGSYENYLEAKLKITDLISKSTKPKKVLVVNEEDKEVRNFIKRARKVLVYPFSIKDISVISSTEEKSVIRIDGQNIQINLPGMFNIYNVLSSIAFAKAFGITPGQIKNGVEKVKEIKGRLEKVSVSPKQNFDVYVDYAHTADSLEKVYKTFENKRKICVLGSTGGGRDSWKRPAMGALAEKYCDMVIVTNEDPYDEDPMKIASEVASGSPSAKIIIDRREAIRKALETAHEGTLRQAQGSGNESDYVVLISGKGTDPYIMGPKGSRVVWSDKEVAEEELNKLFS